MNEINAEFLIFVCAGAALGAVCLAPVFLVRLITSLRGGSGGGDRGAVSVSVADLIAPEPVDETRIRRLEYEAVQSRVGRRRASAVRSLRELGREETITTMLVAALDPKNVVRCEAARGIASLADPDAVEPLIHVVASARNRRGDAARAAIIGLGPVALPELRRLERDDPDPRTRRAAAKLEHALA
ncbi:MAG: HEAT repeat domain-containing protein [Solirubrobacterales bacterium]